MMQRWIRAWVMGLALLLGSGALAQGRETMTREQCDFVAILGLMSQDLRAIGSTTDPQVQAAHRQILRHWMGMVGPSDVLTARGAPALRLHADDIGVFLAAVSRYLRDGGAIMQVTGLARMEHMVEGLGCPVPQSARVQALIAQRPGPADWLSRLLNAFAKPEMLIASETIYGSRWHQAMFLFGMSLFAAASGVMIHRNQRQRRMEMRHPCHIPSRVRQGRDETEITIKDLSCMGAKLTRPDRVIGPSRLWVQVEGVWLSTRIAWRNAHFIGVAFDHPLNMAQVKLALGNAPPYEPPPHLRAPLRNEARKTEEAVDKGPVFHSARVKRKAAASLPRAPL
ncbi:PilZ domain-containing protein [Mesobacterium pallidum]|uniref:PilZ domain-containing protein n=1 Tax=Mesobacterium pallidum TaxID=2872037 RepID=UPI001EE2F783|nr:PilZ domain-containing protein [Mesobacterium pallidum]